MGSHVLQTGLTDSKTQNYRFEEMTPLEENMGECLAYFFFFCERDYEMFLTIIAGFQIEPADSLLCLRCLQSLIADRAGSIRGILLSLVVSEEPCGSLQPVVLAIRRCIRRNLPCDEPPLLELPQGPISQAS